MGKSHLEARDGAGFHEQHLEFQLHHAGQTQQATAMRAGGDGSAPDLLNCHFYDIKVGRKNVKI